MSFLAPLFLFALAAIAVPIIIHLIQFRKPKKQVFSTLIFFKQLKKSSVRWLRIKKLLLLAMRAMAIILLALAVSRPVLSPGFSLAAPDRGNTVYTILIENGPAMAQIDERGPYLDQVKEILSGIAENAASTDLFLIHTTHGELDQTEPMSASQALRYLESLEVINEGNFVRQRLQQLISRSLNADRENRVLLMAVRGNESWKNKLEDIRLPDDFPGDLFPVHFIHADGEPVSNTGVRSVSTPNQILAAGRPFTVEVEVVNYGSTAAVNQFLTLEVNGEPEGQYQVSLDPEESRTFSFEVEAAESGTVLGRAILEGDSFSFDNVRYFSFSIPEERNILLVTELDQRGDPASWLNLVFRAAAQTTGQISFETITPDQFDSVIPEDYDSVIFEGVRQVPSFAFTQLQRYVQGGGGLIIIPGSRTSTSSLNDFLSYLNAGNIAGMRGESGRFEEIARLDRITRGHPVLEDIFEISEDDDIRLEMPRIYHYWRYVAGDRHPARTILQTNLDEPVLTEQRIGEGRLMMFTLSADPSWSAFPTSPLFAPVFYRTALYASASEQGGMKEHILGEHLDRVLPFTESQLEISLHDEVLVPETRQAPGGIRVQAETYPWSPGWAEISGNSETLVMAVNQNVSESDLNALAESEFLGLLQDAFTISGFSSVRSLGADETGSFAGFGRTGREIWNWFIVLALVFLLTESVITRKFRISES